SVRVVNQLSQQLATAIPIVDRFAAPTINGFAARLREKFPQQVAALTGERGTQAAMSAPRGQRRELPRALPIAVVGMACRVPGADDIEQFWDCLQRPEDQLT